MRGLVIVSFMTLLCAAMVGLPPSLAIAADEVLSYGKFTGAGGAFHERHRHD